MFGRNAFNKDIFREIKNTIGKFLGIMAIVMLGVSFFAGLGATGVDMQITGDHYFDQLNLMDIRVVSSFGLNQNDIKALQNAEGVKDIQTAYNLDAQVIGLDSTIIVKVHSLDTRLNPSEWINSPILLQGSYPKKNNEAVVEQRFLNDLDLDIGDTFVLESGKKKDIRNELKTKTFKIVGVVESPYYISTQRGTGSIGNGSIDCFILIPKDNFSMAVYSEAFITVESVKNLICFSDEYEDTVQKVIDQLEDIGDIRATERYHEMTRRAYDKLEQSEYELAQQKQMAENSFYSAENTMAEAEGQITSYEKGLTDSQNDIQTNIQLIDESIAAINSGLDTIRDESFRLTLQESELTTSRITIQDALNLLDENRYELQKTENGIQSLLTVDKARYDAAMAEIEAGKRNIRENEEQLLQNLQEITTGLEKIEETRLLFESQISTLSKQKLDLENNKQELTNATFDIQSGKRSILAQKNELAKSLKDFETEKINTQAQLQQATLQLEQARETLNDLEEPKWYVMDRESNSGYSSFREDSYKIEAIGKVFPLIFFIVAALVSLTTITRMVEERRVEIGTLKSLGYGNFKIMSKYIIYATAPTLIGGTVGGYFGMQLYPYIIIDAYRMLYNIPSAETPVNVFYWVTGILIGVLCTTLAAIFSCINELRSTPSHLMRPKAPKAGKRTIMEKITFLWRALTFSQKVTIRNILRYKKRFLMTVIGIGGCTALLVTGFGMRDSISGITTKQYNEIYLYDMTTYLTDSAKEKDISTIQTILTKDSSTGSSMIIKEKSMDAGAKDINTQQITLIVPNQPDIFSEFVDLRSRSNSNKQVYQLSDEGVLITEKLSKLLDADIGDEIYLKDDEELFPVTVLGITEHYILHNVYMTPTLYEKVFDEDVDYNTIFTRLIRNDEESREKLAETILDKKHVNAVVFNEDIQDQFSDVVDNLNFVIFVLIASAGTLAFVVLLNLTTININERVRELATIEVLGFYDREVSAYVYRENAVLTAIGIVFGLVLGIGLHLYVILTAETETMMFGRDIALLSFVYSVILTIFFAVCVNMVSNGKLRKINMVEALKSVE